MNNRTQPSTPKWQAPYSLEELLHVYRKVLSKPSVGIFAEEMRNAEWKIMWVQALGWVTFLGISALLTILLTSLGLILAGSFNFTVLFSTFGLALLLAILIPMLLCTGTLLTYLTARVFGGQGTLLAQSYTCFLFQIPLYTITSLLTLIPTAGVFLGVLFGFGAFIYGMVLQVFAVIAVHRLNARTAIVTVFIPAVVELLLAWFLIAFISATF